MFEKIINRCREGCRKRPRRIVFTDALDERVLQTVRYLKDENLADPILIGAKSAIRDFAARFRISLTGIKIRQPRHDPEFDHLVRAFFDRRKAKGLTRYQAESLLNDPLWYGSGFVARGLADLVMTGNQSPIKDALQAVLQMVGVDEAENTVSGFYLLVSPDNQRALAFADCCVLPRPTAQQLASIAVNTGRAYAQMTEEEPRVALLSFSTMGSARHELVDQVTKAVQQAQGQKTGMTIEGELQFDAAIVPEVAAKKAPGSKLQGQANVLIFPSLNAANIGYKIARDLAGWHLYGPFYTGFRKPVHGLPATGSAESFIKTTILACCLLEKNQLNLSHS